MAVSHMRSRKRLLFLVVAPLATCVTACLLVIFFPFISSDLSLAEFNRQFQKLQHPAGTTPVARFDKVGLIAGDGNHCDYLVGELREYSGQPDVIEQFYADEVLYEGLPVELVFIENRTILEPELEYSSRYWVLNELYNWSVDLSQTHNDLYFVYIFSVGHYPMWDLRCN
jgi:hypothetical protein